MRSSLVLLLASLGYLATGCRSAGHPTPTTSPRKPIVLTERVTGMVFNGNEEIVTTHQDSKMRVWDVTSGALKRELLLKGVNSKSGVALGPALTVAVSENRVLKIWDTQKNLLKRTIVSDAFIRKAAFSKEGRRIAVVSGNNLELSTVKVYDIATGALRSTFSGGEVRAQSVDFSPRDSHMLAVGDNGLLLWDMKSGQKVAGSVSEQEPFFFGARYSPSGRKIVSWHRDKVAFFDERLGKQGKPLALTRGDWGEFIQAVALSPDDSALASSNTLLTSTGWEYPADLKVWNIKTGKVQRTLQGAGTSSYLAYSPDGQYLAVGGTRGNTDGDGGDQSVGQVCLFDAGTGKKKWCSVENAPYKKR